jgi:hypothetical protein
MALLLCECRMLYESKPLVEFVMANMESDFKKNHLALKGRTTHAKVKECVDDILQMVYKD